MGKTMRDFVLVSAIAQARRQSTQLASFALTRFVQLRSPTGRCAGFDRRLDGQRRPLP